MTSEDTSSTGGEPIIPPPPAGSRPSAAGLGARTRAWFLILALAMLAAVAAWLVGESTHSFFKPSLAASENFRDPSGLNREMPGVNSRNGALTYGAFGGLLGLALGMAGGLAGRSVGRAALAAVAGLILGVAAATLSSFLIMPLQWNHRNDDPATLDLLGPLLVHLGLWSATGLAAGLAFGIGSYGSGPALRPARLSDATLLITEAGSDKSISRGFRPARLVEAALAGLVGAMLGTLVYEMAGALLFPHDHTADPFPGSPNARLLARICVAGFVGLGAIRSLPAERRTG
jgi:hypothetical protein